MSILGIAIETLKQGVQPLDSQSSLNKPHICSWQKQIADTIAFNIARRSFAEFIAPSKTSLVLSRGTGSATFTRATTATVQNNDGYLVQALSGEARFQGARRIYNLWTTNSATLANGANKSLTLAAGTYAFSMGAGAGTATFSGTGGATGTLAASASDRVSVNKTITAGTFVVTASVADLVDLQVELLDTQSTQTAGEYVSVGVLSAPYHGAGADGVKYFGTMFYAESVGIGTAGDAGFGVGICPSPPAGFTALFSTNNALDPNYGNYQYSDGSVMCWIPAFYYKWGTGSNGLAVNAISVVDYSAYINVAAANDDGYALHRAFYDGGAVQPGVFVDKYLASYNGGVASSIKNGIVLTSAARGSLSNEEFTNLTGAPSNAYGGAIAAAKTRGANFFCNSRFIFAALAMLSYAHAQASTATTYCAWYHATNNFPKGNNNNALGDAQDATIAYTYDGNGTYTGVGKTGSANFFARTTHNGQNSGVADLNGLVWEVTPGLTSNGTNLYILKTSARMKDVTGSNTLATDLWGATGIAALYDDLGTSYQAWRETGSNRSISYGAATQVFSEATSGNAWNWAGVGGILTTGYGGTSAFGNDTFYDYKPNEMCAISGGGWDTLSSTGVWTFNLNSARAGSDYSVGFRAALYL